MAGTEYFGETAVQPRDHIPVNTMRKSQSHTFAALTRLSTTTHNLPTFNISEISLGSGQSSSAILLSPNSFDPQEPVPEAKDLVVTLEQRTISYLSVSARIRVIDPFSQMKRDCRAVNPPRYQTLRTDREGMIDDVVSHDK